MQEEDLEQKIVVGTAGADIAFEQEVNGEDSPREDHRSDDVTPDLVPEVGPP
jgi:hypothetical protein